MGNPELTERAVVTLDVRLRLEVGISYKPEVSAVAIAEAGRRAAQEDLRKMSRGVSGLTIERIEPKGVNILVKDDKA